MSGFEGELFESKAAEVATVLRALANERRLMVLCKLVEQGEANVGALAAAISLSQSALSQHLATMRAEGLITYRRDGQALWYRIADPRIERLFATLHQLFCVEPSANEVKKEKSHDVAKYRPRSGQAAAG